MHVTTGGCRQRRCSRFIAPLLSIAMLSLLTQSLPGKQLLSPPPQPVDAESSKPIRQLLVDSWSRSTENANQARETFEQAAQQNDSTLLVAFAINRLQQNKTRESKRVSEQLTLSHPDNLDGWMLKTWLNTLEDNFDVALIDMTSLKRQIDKTQNLPAATRISIYRRLGRLIGYLQSPVADRVNQVLLNETIADLLDGVPPVVVQEFNKSRSETIRTHDDLLRSHDAQTQIELAKVQAENEQEARSLEQQNQILAQSESRLVARREQIEMLTAQQTSDLVQQRDSIQRNLEVVDSDIRAIEIELQLMYADLVAMTRIRRRPIHGSTYLIRNQIRNAEYDLALLRNNGDGYANQIYNLDGRIASIENAARVELKQLDREYKRVNGAFRRNLAKLAKLARGPKIASGKRNSMRNRARSLVTYDQLSEELYRQQILGHLTND